MSDLCLLLRPVASCCPPSWHPAVWADFSFSCGPLPRSRDFSINCSFSYSFYILATLSSIWDLSSPTRDWTLAPLSPTVEVQSLNCWTTRVVCCCSLSHVQLFATPWTAAHQASLSITNSQSLLKLMSIESVMPSNHLILCRPLSSRLQSFPASGSFPMSQFFASSGQSIGWPGRSQKLYFCVKRSSSLLLFSFLPSSS